MTTSPSRERPSHETIITKPLTSTLAPKRPGRPKNLTLPPLPDLAMSPVEKSLFDYFMASYQAEYPDLSPSDLLLLFLAGVEFVKYLRVIQEELETGRVLSQARQHPGVQMRALLDQLSVTRRARQNKGPAEDDDSKDLKDFFMSLGQPRKRPN